ncbi:hypothetical protein Tco_0780164 [Tanacetum coccineum]
MMKSYCSLQQSEVSFVESTIKTFLQTPHHPPFLQQLVDVLDHEMSNVLHLLFGKYSMSIFLVMYSSEERSLVNVPSLNLYSSSERINLFLLLGDVDLLLITFNSKLKILDSLLNNQTSGEHP